MLMNPYSHVDPLALEAERFSLTPERAREMLRIIAAEREALRQAEHETNIRPKVETIIEGVKLSEAQERAFMNYLEGIRNGNSNDVRFVRATNDKGKVRGLRRG